MKVNSLLSGILACSFLFSNVSCTKITGCTDPTSSNYNDLAEEDDGSCQYEGTVIFWFDDTTSELLALNDAEVITIEVNGKHAGTLAVSSFWDAAGSPDCGDTKGVTYTLDLGSNTSASQTYKATDEDGFVWWDGEVDFNANTCLSFELDS